MLSIPEGDFELLCDGLREDGVDGNGGGHDGEGGLQQARQRVLEEANDTCCCVSWLHLKKVLLPSSPLYYVLFSPPSSLINRTFKATFHP